MIIILFSQVVSSPYTIIGLSFLFSLVSTFLCPFLVYDIEKRTKNPSAALIGLFKWFILAGVVLIFLLLIQTIIEEESNLIETLDTIILYGCMWPFYILLSFGYMAYQINRYNTIELSTLIFYSCNSFLPQTISVLILENRKLVQYFRKPHDKNPLMEKKTLSNYSNNEKTWNEYKYCPFCGTKNVSTASFCTECGKNF